ncbi:transposable element Tcb1 transposase [Trichonephila clavipes]|uniref:Transposable element Tcb1 transposase n=1 Tax=Trichonephila clavipes TaxID=2585209 RepID=A0A8X6VYJ7_TRICX|nr:transposable element Tcb1 transposase [Trichonephila clavipes]
MPGSCTYADCCSTATKARICTPLTQLDFLSVAIGSGGIMVWVMFFWHSLGSLIIVEGTLDQYMYASVLLDHFHFYMCIGFHQNDGIYQQDNAKCPTAASLRAWLEEHQDEFTVLP